MKKQILILVLFVAAIVAGTSKSYGQYHNSDPRELNCSDTLPLHPRPGMEYEYSVSTPSGDNVPATNYIWWATKNPNFIDIAAAATNDYADTTFMLNQTAGELLSVGTPYGYIGRDSTMTITWSPEILAATEYQADTLNWQTASATNPTPTFVAVLAKGECTNNLEVYEIDPQPAFTVDITNINPDDGTIVAYDSIVDQCTDEVQSAIYNPVSDSLVMDYGADTLYFEVVATNFVNNWYPYFVVESGLVENQTADISWYRSLSAAISDSTAIESISTAWTAANVASADTIEGTVAISSDPGQDISQGVSIFVKVVIHNYDYELDGQDVAATGGYSEFRLSLDGRDDNNTGEWDLANNLDVDNCSPVGAPDGDDEAIHRILPRPTIATGTYDDNVASPDTFIGKAGDINTP